MKAPDKIYVASYNGEAFSHSWTMEPLGDTTATEYIRKDAILEWAEKKKNDVKKFGQRYNEANYYNSGCHDTIQELVDKINEL